MMDIEFRETLVDQWDQFINYHYWGFIGGKFVPPKYDNPDYSKPYINQVDKNKNKIYDGDTVKCNPDKILVKYTNGNESMVYPDTQSEIGDIHTVKFDKNTGGYFPFSNYDSDCGLSNDSEFFEIITNEQNTVRGGK